MRRACRLRPELQVDAEADVVMLRQCMAAITGEQRQAVALTIAQGLWTQARKKHLDHGLPAVGPADGASGPT
eukprot:1306128-Alexandrium_andersonii.AAC.1